MVTTLVWDDAGKREFETGVDHGVLYPFNSVSKLYDVGIAWNGLSTIKEKPAGAAPNPQFADNLKYLNLLSAETFDMEIDAFTYPDEFGACDGTVVFSTGVSVGQQSRKTFGLSYRTQVGNDVSSSFGYKLHLVYGCLAAPSERDYATINDSPAAVSFSWAVSTTPVPVTGLKPTSLITVDSTKYTTVQMAALEALLYGDGGTTPSLPLPDAVIALFSGAVVTVTPTVPSFVQGTNTITIPTVTGVTYFINGVPVTGTKVITTNTIVTAQPNAGYVFPLIQDHDWEYTFV